MLAVATVKLKVDEVDSKAKTVSYTSYAPPCEDYQHVGHEDGASHSAAASSYAHRVVAR